MLIDNIFTSYTQIVPPEFIYVCFAFLIIAKLFGAFTNNWTKVK